MTAEDQQPVIADSKNRFCVGDKFAHQLHDFDDWQRPRTHPVYGGAAEFLLSQCEDLTSHRSGCNDEEEWVPHTKIYVAGVVADKMAKFGNITGPRAALLNFQQVIGHTKRCQDSWWEHLPRLFMNSRLRWTRS